MILDTEAAARSSPAEDGSWAGLSKIDRGSPFREHDTILVGRNFTLWFRSENIARCTVPAPTSGLPPDNRNLDAAICSIFQVPYSLRWRRFRLG